MHHKPIRQSTQALNDKRKGISKITKYHSTNTDSDLYWCLPPGRRGTDGISDSLTCSLGLFDPKVELELSSFQVVDNRVIPPGLYELIVSVAFHRTEM
jgi:hypothetical protein